MLLSKKMKSTSEPLEIHHPSQTKKEFSDILSNKNSSIIKHKNKTRNYSDTQAIVIKDFNKNRTENNNNSDTQSILTSEEIEDTSFNEASKSNQNNTTKDQTDEKTINSSSGKEFSIIIHKSTSSLRNENSTNRELFLNKYSRKTLLGNWVEDRIREDYKIEKCKEIQSIYKNLCAPKNFFEQLTELSHTIHQKINFMDKFILKNEANTKHKCFSGYTELREDSYLKLDYNNVTLTQMLNFSTEYPVISHLSIKLDYSMIFKFESVDRYPNENKTQILYGQPFFIATIEGNYYLYSENNLLTRTRFTHLSPVFFTKIDSINSTTNFKWMFVPLLSTGLSIYEYEGVPVDINSCVLIKHVNTGRYLIICDHLRFSSFYEVACDSLTNKKYFFTQNNRWRILKN
jgi:hypothetical protein